MPRSPPTRPFSRHRGSLTPHPYPLQPFISPIVQSLAKINPLAGHTFVKGKWFAVQSQYLKSDIMNHSTVAHRWANDQYTSKGELNGPRMFATQGNRTIYSHGHHFPIARKTDNPAFPLLFTYQGYSNSTSKHIGEVRNAISSSLWAKRFECHCPSNSPASILGFEWNALQSDNLPALKRAVLLRDLMVARIAARASKRQPESETLNSRLDSLNGVVASHQAFIRDRANELARFAKAFEVNVKQDYPSIHAIANSFLKSKDLMTLSAKLEKMAEKARKAQIQRQAEAAERERKANLELLEKWVEDETVRTHSLYEFAPRLRVKDGKVETSRGASVPARHAVRLFNLATTCRYEEKAWSSPPEKTFKVGHYELTSISANGDVVIGCHELSYDEMARVAPMAKEAYATEG